MLWILVRYVYKSQHIEILKMEGDEVIHVFDVVKSCFVYICLSVSARPILWINSLTAISTSSMSGGHNQRTREQLLQFRKGTQKVFQDKTAGVYGLV